MANSMRLSVLTCAGSIETIGHSGVHIIVIRSFTGSTPIFGTSTVTHLKC